MPDKVGTAIPLNAHSIKIISEIREKNIYIIEIYVLNKRGELPFQDNINPIMIRHKIK